LLGEILGSTFPQMTLLPGYGGGTLQLTRDSIREVRGSSGEGIWNVVSPSSSSLSGDRLSAAACGVGAPSSTW
jgi:hypothetical protein